MREQGQIIYPMSMIHDFFNDEQIAKMSECYDFNPNDTHFHFELDFNGKGEDMLESTNHAQTEWYNNGLPTECQHVFFEDLTPTEQAEWLPKEYKR